MKNLNILLKVFLNREGVRKIQDDDFVFLMPFFAHNMTPTITYAN